MARKSRTKPRNSGGRPKTRDHASGSPAPEKYKVGPGRPPKEYQWKPGQSGNPKGAKRKQLPISPDLKALFLRAFNRKAKMTDGDGERLVTMFDAGMQQLAVQFAKGDRYARRDTFMIIEKFGPEFLRPSTATDEALPANLQAILDAYVNRRTQEKNSSAPSPVIAPPDLLDDDVSDDAEER
jgi:Family of unknown function (DUF5681)